MSCITSMLQRRALNFGSRRLSTSSTGFGSFHSPDVEELIRSDEVVEPLIPISYSKLAYGVKTDICIDENTCFLNHGAFGATTKHLSRISQLHRDIVEQQPLRFFDRLLLPQIVGVIKCLAEYLGSDCTQLVLVPNATYAFNSVIRSLNLCQNDEVLSFSLGYGANKKILRYYSNQFGFKVTEIPTPFPISSEEIIQLLFDSITSKTRAVVLEHVTSNHALQQPILELCTLCREKGIITIVDGAHSLGLIPDLNIPAIGADFFMGNCHKWFCNPRGCGFLWMRDHAIDPLLISHGYGTGILSSFIWQGNMDYSSWLTLRHTIEWQREHGKEMHDYSSNLTSQAKIYLEKEWDSEFPIEGNLAMQLVGIPQSISMDASVLQNVIYHEHNIEIPVKTVGNRKCLRLSSHFYNNFEEIQLLGERMKQVCQKYGFT